MSNLVIGLGEVGQAIARILDCAGHDPEKGIVAKGTYDVVHICIPYDKHFKTIVKEYQRKFKPRYTVIHSSVPVGISKLLKATHSPIRGVHPHLEKGIRTFVKYVGGKDAEVISDIFKEKGIEVYVTNDSAVTEALKLWDTTQYGVMILLNKEIKEFCDKNKLPFEVVYTHANLTYNAGYSTLDRHDVQRPRLKYISGKIGGHCVVQNAQLLNSPTAKRILKENAAI